MISMDALDTLFAKNDAKMSNVSRGAIASAMNQHAYRFLENSLNAARVVMPNKQSTIKPENVLSAFQVHSMLAMTKKTKKSQRGGHAGTVMTGSFFDPNNAVDAARYSESPSSVPVFPETPGAGGVIRHPLPATGFPLPEMTGGGGGSWADWLSMSSVNKMIKEYSARNGGCRVSSNCKQMLRAGVANNMQSIVSNLSGNTVTLTQLKRHGLLL